MLFRSSMDVVTGARDVDAPIAFAVALGGPASVTLDASSPFISKVKADVGLYAQDQWKIRKLTVNAGLRYGYFEGYVPPQDVPANKWVNASHYDAVKGLPKWNDLSPRVGAAYDLFGNGRTAIKASLNRYVRGIGGDLVNLVNPVNSRVTTANRTWTDSNGDFVPDCNMRNPAANGPALRELPGVDVRTGDLRDADSLRAQVVVELVDGERRRGRRRRRRPGPKVP